jgi:Protein kinase domain/FG-GAP repeat
MAVVYLAHQAALDRDVALKRLNFDSDPLLAHRFVREARLAAALDHTNVVTVFDFFEGGGVPYIAMEYVAGGSLRPFVGRLTLPQIFRVLEGVLTGLGHAEERGVAHRDLKPENVLLTRRGAVKIADFGIARAYDAATAQLTSTSSAIGTPAYMAPEQAQNHRLGPYTDLYAVGVIAYELLAGRPPFEGTTPVAVLYQHVNSPPPPLAEVAPQTPAAVRAWVSWLLAKDPSGRPATATDAWEALEELAVGALGPYWRRAGTITAPERTAPAPAASGGSPHEAATTSDSPPPPVPEPSTLVEVKRPDGVPRRRIAAVVAAVVAAGVLGLVLLRSDEPASARPATPFDFDGDGREELVLGMPRSAPRGLGVASGVVVVHEGPGTTDPLVIAPSDAGVRGPLNDDTQFGGNLASGDFDRDGRADLAISAPGRELVAVMYGTERGLGRHGAQSITGAVTPLRTTPGRYGLGLTAADLDGDGFGDLVIGAPGLSPTRPHTGVMQAVFGSADGLQADRATTIEAPAGFLPDFGNRVRAGDLNRDGHVDVVAGAPDRLDGRQIGHLVYCPGSPRGPSRCRRVGAPDIGGSSSLAIADVTGDGYEDIVQGDGAGKPADGGVVRVWPGGRDGPAERPIAIDQSTPGVPGRDEPRDGFGLIVDVGDIDPDGIADMIIAAPGEDQGAGQVTILRGGKAGYASANNSVWNRNRPGVPGKARADGHFGSALGLLRLTDDDELDLVVIAGGARRLGSAVTVIEGTAGAFDPSEAPASLIDRLEERVAPTGIEAIRLGRPGRQPRAAAR